MAPDGKDLFGLVGKQSVPIVARLAVKSAAHEAKCGSTSISRSIEIEII
jgi:hypothetical protein